MYFSLLLALVSRTDHTPWFHDYLICEFTNYYNTRRAHMERDHLPPIRDVPEEVETLTMDQIEVKSYVGGLVKSFERKAA